VAEQSGLIIPLGKWVIQTACRWAVQQVAETGATPSISVNISPRQFNDADLVPFIGEVIENTGIEASSLQLEISESMAFNVDSVATTLGNLRKLGVRIAIDGFGTGYAALSRLQELPVDIVKIDKSFVRAIEVDSVSEVIVTAIVNMARILDYYVVAEGVETASELMVIRKTGCHAVQGYYLGKPMLPEKLKEALANLNELI
jgi:EAL domain-containing protein (putative c-di-GMP-specific phosphodiesterase class I)